MQITLKIKKANILTFKLNLWSSKEDDLKVVGSNSTAYKQEDSSS